MPSILFSLPGSSEGDVHGRANCHLVCISHKAFWSFHAPTDLWNSVLKTKPVFKAVTVFSFTSLHFSWGREALAKSCISSVKIIILAYSLLFFFSWGFNSGRLMQSKWIVLPVLSQTAFPRHASILQSPDWVHSCHTVKMELFPVVWLDMGPLYSDATSSVLW